MVHLVAELVEEPVANLGMALQSFAVESPVRRGVLVPLCLYQVRGTVLAVVVVVGSLGKVGC
jgi:hypothetical protein